MKKCSSKVPINRRERPERCLRKGIGLGLGGVIPEKIESLNIFKLRWKLNLHKNLILQKAGLSELPFRLDRASKQIIVDFLISIGIKRV